jgi:hypothetical protein
MTTSTTTNNWDPLSTNGEIDPVLIAASQKRQIMNILKSYVGTYDSFSELIQNSMDAVEKRKFTADNSFQPKLWLTINLKENSFAITDNGIGFKENEFKTFLAPNISFKKGRVSRGSKGVGATYIAYGFNSLTFGTKNESYQCTAKFENGRNWVEDTDNIVSTPHANITESEDDYFKEIDCGSTFKIIFKGDNVRPKDLNWYMADTAEQWKFLLIAKTPLGSIKYNSDEDVPIEFHLRVFDKQGIMTEIKEQKASYIFPHTIIPASKSSQEIKNQQLKLINDGKDPSKLPAGFYKLQAVYEILKTSDFNTLIKLNEHEKYLISKYAIEAYGCFVYSTSVWDQLNDNYAKLRKGFRFIKGGLQLANNRMVQGEQIVIPLTSNTGYQNQTHVIVHMNGADPDLGRKGFQPELKELGEKIAVSIVNKLKGLRSFLKSDTGESANIGKEVAIHDWIRDQELHETTNPLIITNKNFFAPLNEISISSTPRSEQDVIVLFNQLVAGGVIRGIKLLSTSQIQKYDGIFKYDIKEPYKNHEYDKSKNPLGVAELHHTKNIISAPKILEYKFSIDGLIAEFTNGEKNESEISLAIAWELGDKWKENYNITSLLNNNNIHLREFHGITHILTTNTTKFHLIILKELVTYLNDVDSVQHYHFTNYGDD